MLSKRKIAPPTKKSTKRQSKASDGDKLDGDGKRTSRCRKKAKATKMAASDSIPASFRMPDPVVVNDYWVLYALPQKALFRDLLHLSASELEKIDGFVEGVVPAPPQPAAPVVDMNDEEKNPCLHIDLSDMVGHFELRPLTPPPTFEEVIEMCEEEKVAYLKDELHIVEQAQYETNVLREQNYRIKKEMAAADNRIKSDTTSNIMSQVAIDDAMQHVSATAQSKLFAVAAQRYEKEHAIAKANEVSTVKRKSGNEKKAAILSYVERNLGSELRHINSTQKLVLEVEIPKAVEVGGGVDGAIPDEKCGDMTDEQRAKVADFHRRLRPVMDQLKSQSTIKAMITKRVTEVRSVIKPLTRHLPQAKNNYVRSGEFTKQKRAEKVAKARTYSKTGKHITDYQKPRFAKQRDLQIEDKAKKLNLPADVMRSAVLGNGTL